MTAHSPGRPLPEEILDLVSAFARVLASSDGAALQKQSRLATVVTSSPTMVDVLVPDRVERLDAPDGPLPVSALVHDEQGDEVGEILVWVKDGLLLGVEQAWFTDQPPQTWPPVERVKVH